MGGGETILDRRRKMKKTSRAEDLLEAVGGAMASNNMAGSHSFVD